MIPVRIAPVITTHKSNCPFPSRHLDVAYNRCFSKSAARGLSRTGVRMSAPLLDIRKSDASADAASFTYGTTFISTIAFASERLVRGGARLLLLRLPLCCEAAPLKGPPVTPWSLLRWCGVILTETEGG